MNVSSRESLRRRTQLEDDHRRWSMDGLFGVVLRSGSIFPNHQPQRGRMRRLCSSKSTGGLCSPHMRPGSLSQHSNCSITQHASEIVRRSVNRRARREPIQVGLQGRPLVIQRPGRIRQTFLLTSNQTREPASCLRTYDAVLNLLTRSWHLESAFCSCRNEASTTSCDKRKSTMNM